MGGNMLGDMGAVSAEHIIASAIEDWLEEEGLDDTVVSVLRASSSTFNEKLHHGVEEMKPIIVVAYTGRQSAKYNWVGESASIWETGNFTVTLTATSSIVTDASTTAELAEKLLVALDGATLDTPFTCQPVRVTSSSYTLGEDWTLTVRLILLAEFESTNADYTSFLT